jgi:polysaccharide deacetylase 2 family uncharacterized protein YibQ
VAARFPGTQRFGSVLEGWRGLGRFWAGVFLLLGVGVSVLAVLGPPPGSTVAPPGPALHAVSPSAKLETGPDVKPHGDAAQPPVRPAPVAGRPGRDLPGPVAEPDPTLMEPYPADPKLSLPRIAADGRTSMAVYAAGFDPTSMRPRVGMLIAGIGMSEADSLAAIKDLPGGVSLAISPYAHNIGRLLDAARITEHEYLLSIPMEPQGYPANDPDDRRALMTSLPPAESLERLRWVLSRLTGYVGVTNALGQMAGERLAAVRDQFGPVLQEVAHRGLLFVDARTGQPVLPYVWNRSVDIAIDSDPVSATAIDQRLDSLNRTALDKGSALGIVLVPRPVTLERVAAWTNTLAGKGLALAPVSALVLPPTKQEAQK